MGFALKYSSFKTVFDSVLRNENILSAFFLHSLYNQQQNYLMFTIPPTEHVRRIIRHIYEESYSEEPYSNEIACSYMALFFALVMRNCNTAYQYYTKYGNAVTQMPMILAYIKSNYRTVTLAELSAVFSYERAYLGKKIKAATGMSYNEIINSERLRESERLLTYTNMSVEAISEAVGYNSADHFSRVFKGKYHVSPAQFRKEIRSGR